MQTTSPRPSQFMTLAGGELYNAATRQAIRPGHAYAWHHRMIESGRDLRACLRAGDYAWPGGYALGYLTDDGGLLCPDCVRSNLRSVTDSIRTKCADGWRVVSLWCAAEADEPETCSHCDETIE